jgi:hypothetical protein
MEVTHHTWGISERQSVKEQREKCTSNRLVLHFLFLLLISTFSETLLLLKKWEKFGGLRDAAIARVPSSLPRLFGLPHSCRFAEACDTSG